MAGMTAAWRLSHQADEPVEITVYEQSWQLGGKGASGRGVHGHRGARPARVARLLRECVSVDPRGLRRTQPRADRSGVSDARLGATDSHRPAASVSKKTGPDWQHWVATFRATDGEPGDAGAIGGTAAPAGFYVAPWDCWLGYPTSLLEMRAADRPASTPAAARAVVLSGSQIAPRAASGRGGTAVVRATVWIWRVCCNRPASLL